MSRPYYQRFFNGFINYANLQQELEGFFFSFFFLSLFFRRQGMSHIEAKSARELSKLSFHKFAYKDFWQLP